MGSIKLALNKPNSYFEFLLTLNGKSLSKLYEDSKSSKLNFNSKTPILIFSILLIISSKFDVGNILENPIFLSNVILNLLQLDK